MKKLATLAIFATMTLGLNACESLGIGGDKAETASATNTETFEAKSGYSTATAKIAAAPGTNVDSTWHINIDSRQAATDAKPAPKPPAKPTTKTKPAPKPAEQPCPEGQERINACCTKQ